MTIITPAPKNTEFITTFSDPAITMVVKRQYLPQLGRFMDFKTIITIPIQSDNSLEMSEYQFNKIISTISDELKDMVGGEFPHKTGVKEMQITNPVAQTNFSIRMTTVDVAEQTGKEHRNVLRDTRNMLTELYGEGGLLRFEQSYINDQGKNQPCYALPKIELLTLISGYSIPLRAKIITRLEQLEIEKQQGMLNYPNIQDLEIRLEERIATRFEDKLSILQEQMKKLLPPTRKKISIETLKEKNTVTQKEAVLYYLLSRESKGATDKQLQAFLNCIMSPEAMRKHVNELIEDEQVELKISYHRDGRSTVVYVAITE